LFKIAISARDEKLETESKRLQKQVLLLKMAIEDAIVKRQRSLSCLEDSLDSRVVSKEALLLTCSHKGSQVIGWLDDF